MTGPEIDQAPQFKRKIDLWDAIHRYVVACGGDPGRRSYGNAARMNAVSDVEKIAFGEECVDSRGGS